MKQMYIELVQAHHEDMHEPDINLWCAHPTREDEIEMFENERNYIKTNTKVIEEGYFKEWKVGTSSCALMLEDSNLSGMSLIGTEEVNCDMRPHVVKELKAMCRIESTMNLTPYLDASSRAILREFTLDIRMWLKRKHY